MNTKIIMTISALILGGTGVALTFAPDNILTEFGITDHPMSVLLMQMMGGLYFGFGMLNWMSRDRAIGGIYNRPVAIANFSHFLVAGLAIIKSLTADAFTLLWVIGGIYVLFGILFIRMLFQQTVGKQTE